MIQEPANLHAIRCCGLGTFATWPDELVAYFLANAPLSTRELLVLSRASKLMRLFVCEEPLWLQRHLDSCLRPFEYRVSPATLYETVHEAQEGLLGLPPGMSQAAVRVHLPT